MPTFVQILDFIGTFAFAISGIRLASAKRFDWFGAYVVGLATAIGGGTIRDVLLDVTPGWMTDPIYLICTGVALLWVICFGRWLIRLNNTFFIFDTIGGVLFAKFLNLFLKEKINPLIGSAGVSAVPMAARVSQVVGQKENPSNFLLMHAMGPNVAGVIGSAIAAGVLMSLFG